MADKKTKICAICGREKTLPQFCQNPEWKEEGCRDIWCRTCLAGIQTKQRMQEYFKANCRAFSEEMWEIAMDGARKTARSSELFNKAAMAEQQIALEKLACSKVPDIMNEFYVFTPNIMKNIEPPKEERSMDDLIYSAEFNGWYTEQDLNFLESYYKKLQDDFAFEDESLRDYARKVCKASLQADKMQNAYIHGDVTSGDVKDAIAQFDMLSKSANFAACRRKPGDNSGMTSFSELALKLESGGHTMTRQIEWPQDDVDRTISEFTHIIEAINLNDV